MNMLQNTGRRSGRASATHIRDAGKVSKISKISKMSSRHRVSAKSSVSRPNLNKINNNFIATIMNNVSAYQDHKHKSPQKRSLDRKISIDQTHLLDMAPPSEVLPNT